MTTDISKEYQIPYKTIENIIGMWESGKDQYLTQHCPYCNNRIMAV